MMSLAFTCRLPLGSAAGLRLARRGRALPSDVRRVGAAGLPPRALGAIVPAERPLRQPSIDVRTECSGRTAPSDCQGTIGKRNGRVNRLAMGIREFGDIGVLGPSPRQDTRETGGVGGEFRRSCESRNPAAGGPRGGQGKGEGDRAQARDSCFRRNDGGGGGNDESGRRNDGYARGGRDPSFLRKQEPRSGGLGRDRAQRGDRHGIPASAGMTGTVPGEGPGGPGDRARGGRG